MVPTAESARRDFYFQPVTAEPGLLQNTVNDMVQDHLGFVWIATEDGLNRYDGQGVRRFRQQPDDPTSLPDSHVTALALAPGGLWVGTSTQYVVRLDFASGAFERPEAAAGITDVRSHYVTGLLNGPEGLWIASAAGVELLAPTGRTRERRLELGAGETASELARDRHGRVWVATSQGVYRFDDDGADPHRIEGLPGGRALVASRDGSLWFAAGAVYRIDPDTGRYDVWLDAQRSPRNQVLAVTSLVEDAEGRLWIGIGDGGLTRLDPANGEVLSLRERPGVPGSLPENRIRALMVDRSGLLWTGGEVRGVSITDPAGARFTYFSDQTSSRGWTSGNSVRSVLEDDRGGLWVGTDTDGLKRLDLRSGEFEHHGAALFDALMQPAGDTIRVHGLAHAGQGRLWVSTGRGLLEFDPQSNRARQLPVTLEGQGHHTVTALRRATTAADGGLWLGTSTLGLLHYDPVGGRTRQFRRDPANPHSLSHDFVYCVLELEDGRVWVCTGAGLNLLDPASGHVDRHVHDPHDTTSLSGDRVRALLKGGDGTIWVGTQNGLDRLVIAPDGRVRFERQVRGVADGHSSFTVYNLLEDVRGVLWLGTNEGAMRFDPGSGRFHRYGMRDGLQDMEFNGGAELRMADGRLVLGGIRGLNVFDPMRMADSAYQPQAILLGARIGSSAENQIGLAMPQSLSIEQQARTLRLQFGALDFAAPGQLRYRYRLDGFDREWVDVTGGPEATYTNLGRGRYTFRVQASNRDGLWSPHELVLPITLHPPWWNSTAAHAAYALALLLASWLLWRAARGRQRQKDRLLAEIRERDERLKLALWGSGDEFWDWRISDDTIYRLGGEQVFDADAATPVTTDAWRGQTIHPDDLARVQAVLHEHILGNSEAFQSEHRIRSPEGRWVWVRSRGRVVQRDRRGQPLRIAGIAHDITASRRAERERRIAAEVLTSMAEAVAVVDLELRFVSVNPAFSRITGYAADEVLGKDLSLLDSSQHPADFYGKVRGVIADSGHWAGEIWQKRKDEEEFLGWLECSEVVEEHGARSHYVIVVSDVTDKKRAEQELRYLANYDTLTGLPNRTLLSERLARSIVRARRQDTRVAVLFLDLDRFKDINDSLGHAAGDRILKATAARLLATVRSSDTVARLSGDEFTVVLEDVESIEMVDRIARDILAAFAEPLDLDDRHDVSISPSIGISLYPDHALVPTDLLKFADTAMYQAKSIGRNTYQLYTEAMDAETRKRAMMAAALRRALDRGEFRLVFQPRLSLADGTLTGVEALLRWHSSELGEISPEVFIPLAEETGLILRIGEWVAREACMTLRRWRHHGLSEISMSINVSVLQLLRGHVPELLEQILIETEVPGNRVEFEVTESMVMANAEQTTAVLSRLRDMGVSIAIDDFGTGYSSLVYLKRLPIDTLKIDKEFIGDLTSDPDDEAITATVITMAHSLGLNVVAEGVETQQQMDYLRAQGCDEIQGYWLSAPLDAHHCLAFMRTWHPAGIAEIEV